MIWRTITDNTPRVHPDPGPYMTAPWEHMHPPPTLFGPSRCIAPRRLPQRIKAPRFSGNAHQRRVKRRAYHRARQGKA